MVQSRRWHLVLAAAVLLIAWTAYAAREEFVLRRGPYGVEAVQISDYELSITDEFDDGPYLRYEDTGIEASWVCRGKVIRQQFPLATQVIPPLCGYGKAIHLRAEETWLATGTSHSISTQAHTDRIVALSDPHGQYQTMLHLLQAHAITDAQGNWAFGSGHLVLTGDVFDRGHQVTEILWWLYQLEHQAEAAGGRLHFLLGNHEFMALAGEQGYVNGKYRRVEELLGVSYAALYDDNTVLGRWLRSRDTVLKLQDLLFMHAGLSVSVLAHDLSLAQINEHYRRSIGLSREATTADPILRVLHGDDGPVWYRGYFRDDSISQAQIDRLADQIKVRHIIVGHTSAAEIYPRFQQRVIGIDTSIKKGQRGELLLWQNGQLWRATYDGRQLPL